MDVGNIRVVSRGLRILRAEGKRLYASSGYRILRSDDGGDVWELDGIVRGVPSVHLLSSMVGFLSQTVRTGVFDLVSLPGGERLAVCKGMIARAEADSDSYVPVFRFQHGSRPLNICLAPDGAIYWGEYFLNLRRKEPVRIYVSRDAGSTWDVAYAFKAGEICHIHRIFHDPYDGSLVVTTGDRDSESFIYRSNDGFRTLELIAGGSQHFRTASVVPMTDGLLYGTDDPGGQNHIILLKREGGYASEVADVHGPVMYGTMAGNSAIFSTMQELDEHEVSIWAGKENGFQRLASLPLRKTSRLWREIAGYPRVILPHGACPDRVVFATPEGTDEFNGSLIKLQF